MSKVNFENATKIFGKDIVAVKDFNLEISDQEFVVLVGPSGCGKTTTLRMLAGLEFITSGSIYIGGKIVNYVPPKDRNIAMVFQNYALYPHMNVFENIGFGLRIRKFPREEIKKRVLEVANILGIKTLLTRKPRELSGGERQRVAMGRAIVRKPEVFLFDEPISNLDAKLRVQMRAEIKKLHEKLKTTIIYVTHDQIEAMTLADRIVVMKDGIIQQIGEPLHVYSKPSNIFVAGFIGSPSMNFITCKIIRKDSEIYIAADHFQLTPTVEQRERLKEFIEKEVIIGIRPEDLCQKMPGLVLKTEDWDKNTVKSKVEVVEPIGSEVHLMTSISKQELVVIISPQNIPKLREEIELIVNMEQLHFFDRSTGIRIL